MIKREIIAEMSRIYVKKLFTISWNCAIIVNGIVGVGHRMKISTKIQWVFTEYSQLLNMIEYIRKDMRSKRGD